MSSKFGETLNRLRKAKGLTMKETGKIVNRGESTVSMWIKGKIEPPMGIVQSFAEYFDVTTDQMVYGLDRDVISNYSNILPVNLKTVNLIGSTAAGSPIIANREYETTVPIPPDIVCDFALLVEGDSMKYVGIENGDIVLVRETDVLENGDIAAIGIDDGVTLKRFYYYPEKNMVVLKPENPDYEDMYFMGSEIETVHIIGKAVALTRRLT